MTKSVEGLGYLGKTRTESDQSGVVVDRLNDRQGYVLYTSSGRPGIYLIDRDGTIVRSWVKAVEAIDMMQDNRTGTAARSEKRYVRSTRVGPNGDLYALFHQDGIMRIDSQEDTPVWARKMPAYNNLNFGPDGYLYVLTQRSTANSKLANDSPRTYKEAYVEKIDPETGEAVEQTSITEALYNSPYRPLMYMGARVSFAEPYHPNSVQIFSEKTARNLPFAQSGDMLVSLRNLNSAIVVRPKTKTATWAKTGRFQLQHSVTAYPDGTMTVFNNFFHHYENRRSQVVHFNPGANETHMAFAPENFFSACCGRVERIDDDRYLVTETEGGRIIEINKDGEVLWEYHNPNKIEVEKNGETRTYTAAVYQGQYFTHLPEEWKKAE